MNYALAVVAGFFALAIGAVFPDVDQALRRTPLNFFFAHRSILTHGFLLPLFLFQRARRGGDDALRFGTIGFCVGLATHLVFDLFPASWYGFANITMPFVGRFPGTLSVIWIVVSAFICLAFAFVLAHPRPVQLLTVASIPTAFFVESALDPAADSAYPLIALGLLAAGAWYLVTVPTNEQANHLRRLRNRFK